MNGILVDSCVLLDLFTTRDLAKYKTYFPQVKLIHPNKNLFDI